MKRKMKFAVALIVVGCIVVFGAAVMAAGGDSTDPLVTLSYLTNVFTPQVEQKVAEAVAQKEADLKTEVDDIITKWEEDLAATEEEGGENEVTANFTVVTLSKGQILTGQIGCEVMLRVGTATCVTDEAPGLIDCTDGSILNHGGSLVKNHLYMVTIETRGVKATADTVKVLARGSYTVE